MHNLIVRGGTVVTAEASEALDVAVDGERVTEVGGPPGSLGVDAREVIAADGCLVVPGGVDLHVHYGLGFRGGHVGVAGVVAGRRSRRHDHGDRLADEVGDVVRGGIPTVKTFMTYGWMTDDGNRFGVMTDVAEAGGMSVVHGEHDALATLVDEARSVVAGSPELGILGPALERLERLERRLRPARRRYAGRQDGDELSTRELAVLRLLGTDRSLREIGSALYVSQNTVKTHTRSIYRKLSASSRSEAVASARERGLL